RLLAGVNLLRGGRGEQPAGEQVLSGTCTGGAEQFEKRTLAEEIEVGRVWVVGIKVALARLSGAGPAVLQAGEATHIKLGSPSSSLAGAGNAVVEHQENYEDDQREHEPPRGEPAGGVDETCQNQA